MRNLGIHTFGTQPFVLFWTGVLYQRFHTSSEHIVPVYKYTCCTSKAGGSGQAGQALAGPIIMACDYNNNCYWHSHVSLEVQLGQC